MTVRSDSVCPRCGGPAVHPGLCVDGDGQVYPPYAALAQVWTDQVRPPLTVDEVVDIQDGLRLAEAEDELSE
jgi:hypothetical protein